MKFLSILIVSTSLFSFVGTVAFSEEWSAAQKEVWETHLKFYEAWKKLDEEGLKKLLHKDCYYWVNSGMVPLDNEIYITKISHISLADFDVKPLKVEVHGNVAMVFPYYKLTSVTGAVYKAKTIKTFIKHNGKWLTIGGMSCSCKRPVVCVP
jgi:hypothetical protein